MARTEIRAVAVAGGVLHTQAAGEGSCVVFVNGLMQTADSWREQVDDVSRYHRTVTYDRRNQGRSSSVDRLTIDHHAGDLADVIRAHGGRQAFLVGQSYGCRIVLELLTQHPQLAAGVVLLSPGVPELAERYQSIFRSWRTALSHGDLDAFSDSVICWSYSCAFARERPTLRRQVRARVAEESTSNLLASLDAATDAYSPARLARLRPRGEVRVRVLHGEHDYLTPPSEAARLAALVPGLRATVARGAGHALTVEAPHDVSRFITEEICR